ncbi:mitochondrial import inner membrane translocase subunit TIM50-C-like isoform X2 [Periplaneta americana]
MREASDMVKLERILLHVMSKAASLRQLYPTFKNVQLAYFYQNVKAGCRKLVELPEKGQNPRKNTMLGTAMFSTLFGMLGAYMLYKIGSPNEDKHGNILTDEFSHMSVIPQYAYRTEKRLKLFAKFINKPSRRKLLPDPVQYPYIQPTYTLVLELNGLLMHPEWTYETGWRFKKRPGVDNFLAQLSSTDFEIVIFTACKPMFIWPILNSLDPHHYISYRLGRDATHFINGHHVKDLSSLNRDLAKVIVIDWNEDSVQLHRENALILSKWTGDTDDLTLEALAEFLQTITKENIEDVRYVLTHYKQFKNPLAIFKDKQKILSEKKAKIPHETLARKWSTQTPQFRKF